MKHVITVSRTRRDLGYPDAWRFVRRAVRAALDAEGVTEPCTVDVTFTDDENIREINRQFRNVDASTDVLSFPLCTLAPGKFDSQDCGWDPDSGTIPLGDILISLEHCARQGEEFVSETYGGSLPAFIAAFTARRGLSAEEAEEIQRLIDKWDR